MEKKNQKKLTFAMAMLWIALMLPLSASASLPSDKKVTLNAKSVSVEDVFKQIKQQSGLNFVFSSDLAKTWPKVTIRATKKPVEDVIGQVVGLIGCSYEVKGNIVTITPQKVSGRERTIKGIVRDDSGEPLMGVPVCIGETRVCTVTDDEGFYTFKIPVESTMLKFSYVGLSTEYVQIPQGNADLNRDIVLRSDNQIGEVVVTGIFKKAKESYTGAVSEISKEKLEMYKGTNLLQTLKNIDASINFPINNAAGSNPNVLPNLNIRGSSSLPMSVEEFNQNVSHTVNTPLIIMDGFEISLQKLMDYNDEQIESINILKDAAATAIYGSRGANGVIVVISKTPKMGKLRVTAKAGLSLEIPDLSSYNLLNAKEKLLLEDAIGLYTQLYYPAENVDLRKYYSERMEAVAEGTDIDWLSKPLRNGVGQRYNIQLDGGANEFRWGASLGYNDVEGAMKGSTRRTLTGDITLMYNIKNLSFRNYSTITSNQAKESKYGSFQTYVDQQPYNNPYDEEGNLVKGFYNLAHSSVLVGNPLYDASLNSFNKSNYLEFINNFSVEWLITEGLRLRGKIGISTRNNTSDVFLPAEHSSFNGYTSTETVLRKGNYTYGTGSSTLLSGDLTLSYTKTLADKHQIYVGANYSISEQKTDSKSFRAEGYSNEDLSTIGNALQYEQNGRPSSSENTVRMVGLTGNANYTYDNRYYVDLSYRVDGSSKFGSDKRFAPFWSAGIGWNLHNEKFLRENKIFNNLRLKASYGVTGSQDFTSESTYTTYQYLATNRYVGWSTAAMMGLGNSELTWQETKQVNLGLEFGLFKNRINGQVDVYSKKTGNLLSSMDLPLSVGFPSYISNIGEMKNTGVEASLNVYLIRDYERKFNWMIGGQFVYDKNEITKLSDAVIKQNEQYMNQNVEVTNLFYVGKPMNAIYAVRSLGIDPSTGNEVYLDKDGNITNTWRASDKVYLGPSQPLYRGNFNTMVMWKDFTLNVSFAYHWGGKMYNTTLRDRVEITRYTIGTKNVDARVLSDRWMNKGDNTFFPNFTDATIRSTSRYVFNDRLLQLQSVSLQYRWNTKWLQDMTKLESVIFAINSSDLFHWSSVKMERGTNYPYARNIQGSVTVTF